ncbi:hypothetical protein [Flavobacterium channae]|uniref:hypothetical protein n=1 Tax=Flavobacterium channae TaxID=2897181 RepID=UPI001E601389|nr:hypothetical protein [Flavobacterium channae]UGS24496.1 hypothetical protein LOS89_04275 [Flavobacterium channae]
MDKITIFQYYRFGFNYRILHDNNINLSNEVLFGRFEEYLEFIDDLHLNVTKNAIKQTKLNVEIEKLKKLAKAAKTKSLTVDKTLHDSLNSKVLKIDTVLDAELGTKIGYILDEKRHSNEILTENIDKLFNKCYYEALPTIAQYDFKESGLCLAFDRYTACAFHSLRGTEDVLKWYYSLTLSITPTENDTWGTFETALKNAITANTITPHPSEHLMINIGSIRKYYRNKTQHPQLTYSSDEAQDLLSLCIKTVNEIMTDLKARGLI